MAMEPSGHYWKPLAWYITGAGFTVVTVNPYHVKRSKELDDNSPTKNDRKDAWVIATLVSEGRFFNCFLPRGIWSELRGLVQARQQNRAKLNAAKNILVAILDEYFPEYPEVFKNLLGKASVYVLTNRPFPRDLLQISEEQLACELKKASNNRVGEKRAKLLLLTASNSVGVPEGLDSARLRIKQCIAEIEFWQKQLSEIESAMAEALAKTGLAEYLLSIPGVGVVTAASFLGEVGDINHYDNWRQLRKMAGYNLTENKSGMKQYGPTKISKRGRPGLRCLLYQASLTLVAKNPQFKALYQHLKNRQQNPLKRSRP
ncbi:Transposase [Desulfoscipio geothermicus DSM 3669]|uniref:Transposase n=2 Tax=Desulfoscipio geothermicus TaxID=39060 RepID=A0A1I6ELR8_9FIRM|nr:Transposase [Desulfoscipio geothermicus DSM 3669]